ncbi:MAG: T9SS type A sorting domain-containing protein [Flavobacteriales bacterium]|nr:T9SS type A sorting domain-containing protein [Flavobacteriales bacterium]
MMNKTLLSAILLFAHLTAAAVSVSISVNWQPLCTGANGELSANASGGVGPYTYLWSNGSTDATITGLVVGTYSVTVTDGNNDQATDEIELTSIDYSAPNYSGWATRPYCPGVYPDASFLIIVPELSVVHWGPPPYFLNGEFMDVINPFGPIGYLGTVPGTPGVTYNVTFQDGNGCTGQWPLTPVGPVQWPVLGILNIQGSCDNFNTGSITIAYGGTNATDISYTVEDVITQEMVVAPGYGEWLGPNPGTFQVTELPSGDYRLRQRIIGLWESPECYDELLFTIPDLGPTCGRVQGQAFVDYNENCTRQSNEPFAPGQIIEVLPGPYYATTAGSGAYSLILPFGNYTMTQQSTQLAEHCAGGPIAFTIAASPNTVTRNLPDTSLVGLDVQATLSSGIARPGFEFQYAINVRNLTPPASGATSVSFTYDPTLTYLSATPTPSSVSGNTITWNQAQLTAWQSRSYTIRFQVPPDVGLLGYELVATVSVSTANTDGNLANNSATNLRTITGAYDPNDKLAYTSSGSTELWQINQDEWIDYTIRFQNTGTDTAFHVVITDTLPAYLDPATLIIGAASHNFTWELRDAGTLKFYFPNILLPDSNVNEPHSHGFVGFRIRPSQPLVPGTTIENIANIYFDFNPPVITEPSVLVAEFSTGVGEEGTTSLLLSPVPVIDQLNVVSPIEIRSVRIVAADGRDVTQRTVRSSTAAIDVSTLKAGAYLLIATMTNGNAVRERFLKL